MLLLIPGKHAGFLLWFVLWIWAKSWDIGFAVVMLLDEMLFALMNVRHVDGTEQGPAGLQLDPDLALAMRSLEEVDPTFSLTTYYNIIGIALNSIPIISAYLILGSLRGGAGLISAGNQRFGR